MNLEVLSYTGDQIKQFIPDIARLRIEIFREYPFLYEGDLDYEMRYLNKFTTLKEGIVVLAFDNSTLIGISTGYPFKSESKDIQKVFSDAGLKPEHYFLFGESVLKKEYRGKGIGKRFIKEREAYAAQLGYPHICFFTSIRPKDDPRRPSDYRPLNAFWESQGYKQRPDLVTEVSYKEIGEEEESNKPMIFWIK